MSRRSRLLLSYVCLVFGIGEQVVNAQEASKGEYYRDYLTNACEKLDCYFTTERGIYRKNRSSPLLHKEVVSEEVGTLEELVEKLRRELKGVKVEVVKRKGKPAVIHLIEESLAESKEHPLDRRVSLKFRGTLSELLARLEEEPGGVSEQRAASYPPPPSDSETRTELEVKDATVREVLTEAVLRKGYSRLLWDASSFEQEGGLLIMIRFTGPKPETGKETEVE